MDREVDNQQEEMMIYNFAIIKVCDELPAVLRRSNLAEGRLSVGNDVKIDKRTGSSRFVRCRPFKAFVILSTTAYPKFSAKKILNHSISNAGISMTEEGLVIDFLAFPQSQNVHGRIFKRASF